MQGSYRTASVVETRNLFLGRLRHRVRAVEQEDCNLLGGLLADIHGAGERARSPTRAMPFSTWL